VAFVLNVRGNLGWAEVDALRLRQCLYNLIGNAVKFTAKGQVTVSVWLDARPAGRVLCVSVADTGIGIDASAMESLFERFKQADSSTTRRFGGSGLGLAITRQLAELMGGQVGFISQVGRGSTFTLELLAPACAPGAAEVAPESQEAGEAPLADIAVLVVDDNATNRLIAGKMLERLGAIVTTAESGPEAIERARTMVFDLILMDIQMPGMDGVETTRRLRQDTAVGASTPILALTANVFDEQRQTYLAAGMDGVVAKPISPADLLTEISRAVTASEEREQARASA
jgi:CheY-like chemotaxis protein/anti-sigma regulatory factor (Ser/Thr protein kinase)